MFFLTILLVCAHVYDCYGFFGKDWASFTTAPDHQSYVPVGESFILECSIIGFPTPVVVWSGFNSSDSFRKKSHDYDHELVNSFLFDKIGHFSKHFTKNVCIRKSKI